jgi:23S rRNA pseudouridine2605 synthase
MKNKKNTNQTSFSSERRNADKKSPGNKNAGEVKRTGEGRFSSEKKYTGNKRNSGESRSPRENNFSNEKRYDNDKGHSGEKKRAGLDKFSGDKKSSEDRKRSGGKEFTGEKRYGSNKSNFGDKKSFGAGKHSEGKTYSKVKNTSGEKKNFDFEKFSGENLRSDDKKTSRDHHFSSEKKYSGERKSFGKGEFKGTKKYSEDRKKTGENKFFKGEKDSRPQKNEEERDQYKKPVGLTKENKTSDFEWKESKVTPQSKSTRRENKVVHRKPEENKSEVDPFPTKSIDQPKTQKAFYTKEAPKKEDYEVVYRGRGRDEKPIYETVKKGEGGQQAKRPVPKIKKPSFDAFNEEKPSYNFEKFENKSKKAEEEEGLRLNKYISNSGICSRREADELIKKGEIKVNGEVIKEMGHRVLISDTVIYKGKRINPEKPVYVLLNKPKDFITTTDDPLERKTVMQLIQNACEERLYPVGRLDRNTTGLLLFTNDGELAAKLSHPSSNIKKIYQVTLDKPLTKGDEATILEGFELEDGPVTVDDMQVLSKDRTILGIEIHIGRNRIVKRIFAHFGYEVIALDRVTYAGLDKKDLTRGKYRFLTEKEVIQLKFFK